MEILIYLLKSTAVLGLFFLVYYFVLRKDTYFENNRFFLLLGLACSFGFPFIEFTQITYIETEPILNSVFLPTNDVGSSRIETIALAEKESFGWLKLLLNLYIAGVIFMGIRFLFQLISLLNVLKQPKKRDVEGFYHIQLRKKTSPFSFFHYIAYHLQSYQKNELELIIEHEKIHGKQYHSIDVILHQLMLVFLWFNPFAWWYNKQMLENLEFIADREVAKKNSIHQKEYELTLLKISTHHQSPSLGSSFYQSLIKKRIVMLHKNTSPKYAWVKSLIILPLLSLFLWSFNVKEEVEFIPLSENQPTEIYKNETLIVKESVDPEIKSGENTSVNNFSKSDVAQQEEKQVQVFQNEYIITKKTTDDELKNIKKSLDKETGEAKIIFNVKRNNNGEIILLEILTKFKENKNYIKNLSLKKISSVKILAQQQQYLIKMHDQADIYISAKGVTGKHVEKPKYKLGKNPLTIYNGEEIDKPEDKSPTFNNNSTITTETLEPEEAQKIYGEKAKDGAIIIKEIPLESPKEIIALQTPSMNEKIAVRFTSNQPEPLIFVNHKEVTKETLSQIEESNIKSVNVLKGKVATSKYGEKAKNGAIEITLKKEPSPKLKIDSLSKKEFKENQEDYIYAINGVKADKKTVELVSLESIKKIAVFTEKEAALKFDIETGGKKLMGFQLHTNGNENSIQPKEILQKKEYQEFLSNENAYIILNDKKVDKQTLEKLDANKIKSIFIVNGKKAIKDYGEDAENGVLVITAEN